MAVKSLIETITVGAGGAASIEFAAIPQEAGSDLLLVMSARTDSTGSYSNIKANFNSDGASNYTYRWIYGNGTSVNSTANSYTGILGLTASSSIATADTFGNGQLYIPNYSDSNAKFSSADSVQENNLTSAFQNLTAGSWNDTAAITSIALASTVGNLVQYSTASLYKIKYD